MAQINVTIDDQTSANLDRVAAARGEVRTELVRKVIREAIEAHDAGRLALEIEGRPLLETSINGLVESLRVGMLELERINTSAAKRERQLVSAFTAGEQAVQVAKQLLSAELNDPNHTSFAPVLAELGRLLARVDAAEFKLTEAQQASTWTLAQRIEVVRNAAERPKQQFYLSVGDAAHTVRILVGTHVFAALVGFVIMLGLASLWDGLSVRIASRLADSPARVCLLIEQRIGTHDCVSIVLGKGASSRPSRGDAK